MVNKKWTNFSKITIAAAVFMLLSLCIVPASATVFYPHNTTDITMANGAFYNTGGDTYYFNFSKDGGGLNAIHISNSSAYADKAGDIYDYQGASGTFYITDMSKNPGYSDSAILLFGVPTGEGSALSLTITASGYNWTPTGDGSKPSTGDLMWYENLNIGTFTENNFTYTEYSSRPYFDYDYPLYYDDNNDDDYDLMFIDLSLGTLNSSALNNSGSVKIDYNMTGYTGAALFDVYTWCNQSTQGQGVSWTNDMSSSGWTINF